MRRLVPVLCIAIPLAAGLAAGFSPLLDESPEGSVDWEGRIIHARGEWPLKNPRDGQAREAAERGATLKAQRNALKLAQNLAVDGERLVSQDPDLVKVISMSGTLVGGVVGEGTVVNGMLRIPVTAPLDGARGVATTVVRDFRDRYLPPPEPQPEPLPDSAPTPEPDSTPQPSAGSAPPASAKESVAPILIDARGTRARPALLPKIKKEGGAPVYTASSVAYQDLLAGGQVRYAVATRGAAWLGPRPEFLRIADRPGSAPAPAPRMVRVARADGATRADLTLAAGEERKLETPEARKALRAGKVLVVMDSAVGGVEGWRFVETPALYASTR